jgi:hypothetical protein
VGVGNAVFVGEGTTVAVNVGGSGVSVAIMVGITGVLVVCGNADWQLTNATDNRIETGTSLNIS